MQKVTGTASFDFLNSFQNGLVHWDPQYKDDFTWYYFPSI